MVSDTIFLGVAGLGRAFMLMLETFRRDPRVRLVAAADPRPEARQRFEREFGGRAYTDVEAMCADPEVEAVYVATPHQHHAAHAIAAARAGKHVLVEKPMALTLDEARAMVDAAAAAGVRLVVGPSHSYDAPIVATRALIAQGAVGRPRMITTLNFTDFLYRPRRPEELDTSLGGGVLFSQAAHQVDVVRLLAGGQALSVRCMSGNWDPRRDTEGAYAALITFDSGCVASLNYNGYARFDSDEWCDWIGELGTQKDPARYSNARANLSALQSAGESAAKEARTYGASDEGNHGNLPPAHEHFGPLIVSCEHADLRPTPKGVWIYGDERRFEPLPQLTVPREAVIDELHEALRADHKPLHDGAWGMATLEVCLAMLESSRTGRDVPLHHQVRMG